MVEATIDIQIKSNKIKSPSSIPQGRKNWEKCDVQIYRENIKVELEKQPKSIYQVGENIQELIKALKIAEERAFPPKKPRKSKKKKLKQDGHQK